MLHFLRNSFYNSNPSELALSVVVALIIGLTPVTSILTLILVFAICILRVNFTVLVIASVFFVSLTYLSAPLLSTIGMTLLRLELLQDTWIYLYNNPVSRLLHFNNSIVMGGFVAVVILCIPVYMSALYFLIPVLSRLRQPNNYSIQSNINALPSV